jgi:hypothetical protein
MHYLDGTSLLSLIQQWLDSSDEYLATTSVLALGNFARTDNHCIKMVKDNVLLKLIDILKSSTQREPSDSRLQHALVSKRFFNVVVRVNNYFLNIINSLVPSEI